jgi:hypothetical protein
MGPVGAVPVGAIPAEPVEQVNPLTDALGPPPDFSVAPKTSKRSVARKQANEMKVLGVMALAVVAIVMLILFAYIVQQG